LEKQSTNQLTYSEQFDNAAWIKEDLTVTANATTSPDGTTNADKLIANTSSTDHSIYQSNAVFTGASVSFSAYAKASDYNYIFLGKNNSIASDGVFFDLTNGTISQNTSALTASIQSVGNGWYRCIVSSTSWPTPHPIICLSENGTSFNFAGDSSKGVFVWGGQAEISSYPTSYIPTTSASATRVADACFRNSYAGGITSEGTIFADFEYLRTDGGYATPCLIINGSNYIYMFVISNTIRANCTNGGVIQSQIISSTVTPNTRYKVAATFKTNDFSLYVNGALIGTDTSGTMPTFSTSFNTYVGTDSSLTEPVGKLNELVIFPVGLTNSELASLTTI
jgi:hypothetical protein